MQIISIGLVVLLCVAACYLSFRFNSASGEYQTQNAIYTSIFYCGPALALLGIYAIFSRHVAIGIGGILGLLVVALAFFFLAVAHNSTTGNGGYYYFFSMIVIWLGSPVAFLVALKTNG
jgi:peptidoglycan/LPS O-acetylase OafA/YrhL